LTSCSPRPFGRSAPRDQAGHPRHDRSCGIGRSAAIVSRPRGVQYARVSGPRTRTEPRSRFRSSDTRWHCEWVRACLGRSRTKRGHQPVPPVQSRGGSLDA
jgi:hypothetical protein